MRDIAPLRSSRTTDAEARLLRSARLDVPPRGAKGRLLGSLGLAVGVTAAASTSGVASAAAPLVVGKWLMIGVVSTTVALGGAEVVRVHVNAAHDRRTTGTPSTTSAPPMPQSRPVASPPPLPSSPRSAETPGESPSVPLAATESPVGPPGDLLPMPPVSRPPDELARPAVSRPTAVAVNESPPRRASTPLPPVPLGDELKYLDAARDALARSDPSSALQALDIYHERMAHPRFEEEASVLRIDALVAAGRAEYAQRLGERYLASYPESAYAQHVRSVLRSADAGSAKP